MQPKPFAIGVFARWIAGYYFGAMLTGIHEVTRQVGVPLLTIQTGLQNQQLPPVSAEYVAGWIVIHPMEDDIANLAALIATGVPVVTIVDVPEELVCTSVVSDDRGGTRALVTHLIEHGHRRIAYIDQGIESWSQQRYLGYMDALQAQDIALDPALILDTEHAKVGAGEIGTRIQTRRGQIAAQQLIEHGMPCTALVAGTDRSAIAAMQVLQGAGYRIPEDIAVVGFDDVAEAQYTQPPLTTVRTRFDTLGRAAAEHLLTRLRAPGSARPTRIVMPTRMLCRRSCGCPGLTEVLARSYQALAAAGNWQATLAQQLVQIISYPLAPDPATPPPKIWPMVNMLIAAVEATLQGQDSAAFASDFEMAWQQAVAVTENLELLDAAVALLEDIAEQYLAASPATTRLEVAVLFRQLRMAMMRARLAHESTKYQELRILGETNQDISLTLLASQVGESKTLAWLAETAATWGCLGLWDDAPHNRPATLTVAGVYQRDGEPYISIGTQYIATQFPPFEALPLPAQQGQDLLILFPLRAGPEELGVLALCGLANLNLSFDIESLWLQLALLGATLKRDAMVIHLEDQTLVSAQARDAAEAANKAKSVFLANMSHELRTPLNGILGYAQILRRQHWDPATATGLSIIQQSGEHLLTLIDDILDLAKIEAGRLTLTLAPLQLPTFLDSIVGIIRARAQAKRLTLTFEAPTNLPHWVETDETRLRQVLLNLLGNAVKFTDQGTITLRVTRTEASRTEEQGQRGESKEDSLTLSPYASFPSPHDSVRVRFEITDTGSGIAPEQLETIFQAFEQVGDLARRAEGAGLGLAISRQLVRLMGGELHVRSTLGQGSTFWFAVPLPVVIAQMPAVAAPERAITGYTGPRRTLLVVDDIASNRAVLTAMLQPLGFTVRVAEDSRQAVDLAQQMRPDLILMDRWMPVLSGLEAVRQIRQIPELRKVPIIATSASVSEADQALSRTAGYDAFLPKPIHWSELSALLESYLQLEWAYATVPQAAEEPADLVALPVEQLVGLHELAANGDILALQRRAAELEQLNPEWRPFARELARLAARFESEQILALLRQYLPPAS